MKLYRILTKNKNYQDVIDIVRQGFPSFTVIKANGQWNGQEEHSLIIEIVTDKDAVIESVAYLIRKHNKQESVMVQILNVDVVNI